MLHKKELEVMLDFLNSHQTLGVFRLNKQGIWLNGQMWVTHFQGKQSHRGLQTLKKLNTVLLSAPITE